MKPAHDANGACFDVAQERRNDARDDYEDSNEDRAYQVDVHHKSLIPLA